MEKGSQTEKRGAVLRRALKGGIVAFNDRHSTLPCTVRDISATGARLRVEGSVVAPDRFVLIIELDGLEADCEVVSRRAKELGVKLVSPPRTVVPRRVQVIRPIGRR
jgi:hypothetical protein